MHGYFLLPGQQNSPFYYKVSVIRNGNTYMTRQVHVYQIPKGANLNTFKLTKEYMCYVAILSFKRRDKSKFPLFHQRDLSSHFSLSANRDKLSDLKLAPDVDIPMWIKMVEDNKIEDYVEEIHPVEVRKMDNSKHNEGKEIWERSQIHFFKSHDELPEDPNLHV